MTAFSDDRFTSVLSADSADTLRTEIVAFAMSLGFDIATATVIVDRPGNTASNRSVGNIPSGYEASFADFEGARRDPVMQHCKVSSVPIVWTKETYFESGQSDLWENQADFGLRTGVSVALHLPAGKHFVLGFDRRTPLPTDAHLTAIVADVHLFAAFAQQASLPLLGDAPVSDDNVSLTRREIAVLQWTLAGKTAWEVGRLLGISERTAVKHLANATR